MADLSAKPGAGHRRHGYVRGPDHRLQTPLRLRDCAARSQRSRLDQRDNQPDSGVGCSSDNRSVSLGWSSGLYNPGSRSDLRCSRNTPIARHGDPGQAYRTSFALAEWLCRTADRIDPARVFGPHHCLGRGTSAPDSNFLCRLLQLRQNASFIEQGCADFSSDSTDRNHSFTPDPRRASPSLRPDLSFRYTQAAREEIDDGGHIEPAFACVRGHAVFEFSDDIVELNGVGYWLKTGLGLRRDIAPLSAIAPPRVERDCVTGTASTASQRPCRGGKLF